MTSDVTSSCIYNTWGESKRLCNQTAWPLHFWLIFSFPKRSVLISSTHIFHLSSCCWFVVPYDYGRPSRTPKKDVLFIIGDWNAKVGSKEIPGVTGKFGLGVWNEAGQRLIEFCQENTLVITNTLFQKHKRRLYTWTSLDGRHWNQIDYILCSQRWRSSIHQ